MQTKTAKKPMNRPMNCQYRVYLRNGCKHTWSEVLILLEERLVGRRVLFGVVRIVTSQFRAEGLLVGFFIRSVDGALGFPG